MWRAAFGFLIGLLLLGRVAAAEDTPGPTLDCSHVTSTINTLICGTRELAALDREVADVFRNTSGQAGFDAKALRHEEDAWLAEMHRRCNDVACIRDSYENRQAAAAAG